MDIWSKSKEKTLGGKRELGLPGRRMERERERMNKGK
jgi:hypothetical protein